MIDLVAGLGLNVLHNRFVRRLRCVGATCCLFGFAKKVWHQAFAESSDEREQKIESNMSMEAAGTGMSRGMPR